MTSRKQGAAYFEFWRMDLAANPLPCPVVIQTVTGVILNCHPRCDTETIRHLCNTAMLTPDYPVDLSYWEGPEGERRLVWNARIYYRSANYENRKRI